MRQKAPISLKGPLKVVDETPIPRPIIYDPARPLKIFVKGVNWVGDAVIATAALARLRKTFPDALITLMVRPWVAPVYEHNPDITRLWVVDDAASLGAFWNAAKMIRKEQFTIGVAQPNSLRSAMLLALGNVRYRFGYAKGGRALFFNRGVKLRPEYLAEHQLFYYMHIIEEMCGKPGTREQLTLRPGDLEREEIRRMLAQMGLDRGQPLIGIAPGSINSSAKRWPADRFAALADRLTREANAQVLLLGSMKEADVLDRVERGCHEPVHNMKGKLSLGQLIALTEKLSGLICNDSGAMHIGAALGTPTVAIFGPTEFTTTYPFSKSAKIIRKPVDCAPCMLRECPLDHRCMTGVAVEDVFELFKQVVREERAKRASKD